jgi:predicted metal-dependent TIM-barrel fold hydrolase
MNKVKDIIERLSQLDPESEIIIAYWDLETVNYWDAGGYDEVTDEPIQLTKEQWSKVVEYYQDRVTTWGQDVEDIISEALEIEERWHLS